MEPRTAHALADGSRQGGEASAAPIFVVIEEIVGKDEGSDIFCAEVPAALASFRPVVQDVTHQDGRGPAGRLVTRFRTVLDAPRRFAGGPLPSAVLYVPASRTITAAGLLRARMLRRRLGAPVAMVAFHEGIPGQSRWLARMMPPDLLLLTTDEECASARALGLRAELVLMGVDPSRFRPPEPGEKEALRRKWGVRSNDRVILHVGHLFENRNLRALTRIAAAPGVTMLLVASTLRRPPESENLLHDLERSGVVVISGYQPNIEEFYRLADCYVFPTVLPEGAVATPLSVVEARATGLPVVSRRFRALAGRVGEALGVSLVDSDTELAERALALASAPPELGAVPDAFSWSGIARELADRLDRLEVR
jgi:glycosyltransferase involved in cell wall biosynthesis